MPGKAKVKIAKKDDKGSKVKYELFVYNVLTKEGRKEYGEKLSNIANNPDVTVTKEEIRDIGPQTIYKIIETRTIIKKKEREENHGG